MKDNMRDIISEREAHLPGAMIGKLLKIANESEDVVSLGPGEPDFCAPEYVRESAKQALDDCETHYAPTSGRRELKDAIIKKLNRENGIETGPENIIATNGSTEAILLALMCLVDPGEHVLVPDPGFLAYRPTVELLNGYPVPIQLEQEEGFQMTGETVKEAIKEPKRVRAMIINTPSNPTGTVLKKSVLEEIADIAVEHDIMILADEAYEKFIYGDATHHSIGSLNGMEDYVVTLQSFSKTFAMPGLRVGYAAAPEPLVEAMDKIHIYTSLTGPTPSQLAGAAALNDEKAMKESVDEMISSYAKRRELILKRTREIEGFTVDDPEGAFYAFPSYEWDMTSVELAEWLLENAKVAAMPGSEFGHNGEGFLRFSYATAYEEIEEAMDRLEDGVKELD